MSIFRQVAPARGIEPRQNRCGIPFPLNCLYDGREGNIEHGLARLDGVTVATLPHGNNRSGFLVTVAGGEWPGSLPEPNSRSDGDVFRFHNGPPSSLVRGSSSTLQLLV